PIAAHRGDECETDARIAARGFDDGTPALQTPVAGGLVDHREADAVLHAPARIETLQLRPYLRLEPGKLRQSRETSDRRRADQVEPGSGNLAGKWHDRVVGRVSRGGYMPRARGVNSATRHDLPRRAGRPAAGAADAAAPAATERGGSRDAGGARAAARAGAGDARRGPRRQSRRGQQRVALRREHAAAMAPRPPRGVGPACGP